MILYLHDRLSFLIRLWWICEPRMLYRLRSKLYIFLFDWMRSPSHRKHICPHYLDYLLALFWDSLCLTWVTLFSIYKINSSLCLHSPDLYHHYTGIDHVMSINIIQMWKLRAQVGIWLCSQLVTLFDTPIILEIII